MADVGVWWVGVDVVVTTVAVVDVVVPAGFGPFGLGVIFVNGGGGLTKICFVVVSSRGFVLFGLFLFCCWGVVGRALICADVDGGGVAAGVGFVVVDVVVDVVVFVSGVMFGVCLLIVAGLGVVVAVD